MSDVASSPNIASCSHRGVVNAVKQAQTASGVKKVHGVIGGFHLAPYEEDYVRETITSPKDIDIDYVVPLHCTGEPFYEMAKAEMPANLLRSYTGTRFALVLEQSRQEGGPCLRRATAIRRPRK